MNYIPLFGRWPTLLLVATIAATATALSFYFDGTHRRDHANSSEVSGPVTAMGGAWATSEDAQAEQSEADKIIVVNPDGSVRDSSAALPTGNRVGEEPSGMFPRDKAYRNMQGDGAAQYRTARRIE